MFLYWFDVREVTDGMVIAFFQDVAQGKAENTLCWESYDFMEDLINKMLAVAISIRWYSLPGIYVNIFQLFMDIQV